MAYHGIITTGEGRGLDPGEPSSINTISTAFLSTVTWFTNGLTLWTWPKYSGPWGQTTRILLPNLWFRYAASANVLWRLKETA